MQTEYICHSLQELDGIAADLLKKHQDKRVFALFGTMGAGKTTFIKSLCRILKVHDQVNSPTFAIINEYFDKDNLPVYHFDFYRIKGIEEALDIGYELYFFSGRYCFIEWPEKITELLPENCVYVKIEETGTEGERRIIF
ncbi:MAG: tRNA (adenosine(37)-N6)-threonylcarbamoyltransferase complex ATPase subunit type 1 TsaE [Bacteroidales bacterium]